MRKLKSRSGVSAVVLAAGMSKRMGGVKQLLPFHGEPLLQITIDTLRRTLVDEIVVVLGFEADNIRAQIQLDSVRIVLNEAFRDGMSTSVSAGISNIAAEAQAALVVLADQPFLKPETIDRLIGKYLQSKHKIIIPTHKGLRGNPVLIDHSLFPELKNLSGDVGCRATFGNHPRDILKVPVDDVGVLLDLDTAEDLERAGKIDLTQTTQFQLLSLADLQGRRVSDAKQDDSLIQHHLVVVGASAIAKALASFGSFLKFSVTVVDLLASPNDFPETVRILHSLDFSQLPKAIETYVVVATQGRFDEDALEQALFIETKYVALVSKREKAKKLLRRLAEKGISEQALATVRVPAGLDIGARTPEEIALSIMAQIVSERDSQGIAR